MAAEQLPILEEARVTAEMPPWGWTDPMRPWADPSATPWGEAFAPPLPVLPEVVVTPAPKPVAPPPAPVGSTVLQTLSRVALPIVGLLMPMPSGGPRAGELNEPLPGSPQRPIPLPEVKVIGTRPPRPPAPTASPSDPFPFNLDPLEYYPELPGQRPFVPDFGAEPRPAPLRIGDPGLVADPGLDPELAPAPRPQERPFTSPDPFELVPLTAPGFQPRPLLDPGFESLPRTGTSPRPGTRPFPDPGYFAAPIGDPFFDLAPLAPPRAAPRSPSVPRAAPISNPFDLASPLQPFALEEPRPTKADGCNCAAEKKKPKKKKKPRTICYKGSYTERSKSLRKVRREQIPCQ